MCISKILTDLCFTKFMFHKTKNKNKKQFCKSSLHCFSRKNVLTEHKSLFEH